MFSWDANLITSEEVFEGTFSFRDTLAYPLAPELSSEDPQQKHSLPQRIHTLSARELTRTHWLYTPESFAAGRGLRPTDTEDDRHRPGGLLIYYNDRHCNS